MPDVPNAVKCIIGGTQGGLPWVNMFHLQHSAGSLTQAHLDTVAQTMLDTYVSQFLPILNGVTIVTSSQVIDLSSRTGLFSSASGSHPGTNVVGSPTSNQTAMVISWKITDRYRGGHPRTYIPGMSTADITNGHTWTGAFVNLALASARGFRSAVNAITTGGFQWSLVCVRYFSHHALLVDPLVRVINDAQVHSRVDTMRRRLGKETP